MSSCDFRNLSVSMYTFIVNYALNFVWSEVGFSVGMGIVENSTVRFGSRFCFYGSVLSRFPKRFINDVSWIRNYAMKCVAELA